MKIGDIVVEKVALATVVGKTTDGSWIVEWADGTGIHAFPEENLFLVEESSGVSSEN